MHKFWVCCILSLLLVSFRSVNAFAQKNFVVSGTIKDSATGETLIGATVRLVELKQSGGVTNSYGFYSLTAPQGNYTLAVSFVGYNTITQPVQLTANMQANISLTANNTLTEVSINARSGHEADNIESPQMGLMRLDVKQLDNIPVIFGEKDVLKTIQLLPGIKSTGDGNTGFYVRGGGSDQNLILLDEAIVYNASHLFGFFSTFNTDAIKDVSMYKGGMPAQYGGRMSSVLDIKMLEGNDKTFSVQGGIGLIASRLKVEGPLVKNKGSFMVSARRTYADTFLKLSSDSTTRNASLYFYDINAKANYRFDDKNALFVSGYFGKDVLGLKNNFETNWGNQTATVRFNHIFNSKLFLNTSLIYSNYSYVIQSYNANRDFRITSKIRDFNLKEDFQYFISDRHTLSFGVNAVRHSIAPGEISSSGTSSINNRTIQNRFGIEASAYISDEWKPAERLSIIVGTRLSWFSLIGPGKINTYNDNGTIVATNNYTSGQIIKTYFNPEPRVSMNYKLTELSSVKASYNRNTQNIHLLANSTASTPTDLYVMSSNNIKPGISDQFSIGYFRNQADNTYEFSAEAYYKGMQNLIDYRDGSQLVGNEDVESQLVYGKGRAYGIELFAKKRTGRLTGWIGYTLSKTERKFDAINKGQYFPATYDRTHDISIVAIFKASKRVTVSSTFVYGTGNAVTYPQGKYQVGGITTFYYPLRNADRMPAYHRLDLGVTLDGREHKRFHSSWTFGLYNAYNQKNPYTITFRDNEKDPSRTEAVKTSLFGIVPSVTYNFKF
ncbi:TonB-dependent receptor [Mucilaginibacter auburnensis]|uniref:Outer membrane receptor protein involved in Fe transport n=1 Tax=Mucilaginibacter auburnensis TaxID=1457233 RepID=A0A2H9VRX7_9SPHI|nr:TonB-dependent receptor [Mucilaginibacter auburnensis]PJJ83563.1 outer membrane receptor protein involved in Fe transport [Mucilaginibacter auburnensis]